MPAGPGDAPRADPRKETIDGPDRWAFSTGLNSSYDSNPMFVENGGESDLANRVSAGLSRSWVFRRGDAHLSLEATRPFYEETDTLSVLTYTLGGGSTHQFTRRLSGSWGTNLSSGLAQDQAVITGSGVVLPSVQARTASTSLGLSYAVDPRTNLTWTFSHQGAGFRSAAFQGGAQMGSNLNLSRQLSRTQSVGVEAGIGRMFSDEGGASSVQTYVGTYSLEVGKHWSLFGRGGVRAYTLPGVDGYSFSPATAGGVNMVIADGQALTLSYDRSIEQAFGFNRTHIVQTVAGSYTVKLTRRLSADMGASYAYGTYPLIPDLKLIGDLANASLTCALFQGLSISFTSSLYGRQFTPDPMVWAFRAGVSVGYGTSW
jgi:hypothetical protein